MKILKRKGRLYTKNLVPRVNVYGERLVRIGKDEYREWDPRRSKLGAGFRKGVNNPLKESSKVLYLGASSGTTVSHVSDLCIGGRVYAVEFAPEPMKHLVMLAMKRQNIIPLFANAIHPEEYPIEKVDLVFQDVAQKNQVQIFTDNCKAYLKKNGVGILVIKSRSIDVTKNPAMIFRQVEKQLKDKYTILKSTRLEPFEKDHKLYVLAMK